jgi:cytochrome b
MDKNTIFGVIAVGVCTVWLIIGMIQACKIYRKEGGFPADTFVGLFVFFILPSLWGIALGIISLYTK